MAGPHLVAASSRPDDKSVSPPQSPPPATVGYTVSLAMVALAGVLAYVVEHVIQAPNLSLVFVLPVIIAAVNFGWGPSLVAAVAGVAVFDFFFIEPRLTFVVASPTDLWAMGLLLVVAAIVSTVAAESRRRAVASRRAAEQAEALHGLAHAIINAGPPAALIRAAASALGHIFNAPAVVLEVKADALTPLAASGGAQLTDADREAAAWAVANGKPTRAGTYPFDQAEFDFWPAATAAGRRLALGVRFQGRPPAPERHVDLVAGYLAASSA